MSLRSKVDPVGIKSCFGLEVLDELIWKCLNKEQSLVIDMNPSVRETS